MQISLTLRNPWHILQIMGKASKTKPEPRKTPKSFNIELPEEIAKLVMDEAVKFDSIKPNPASVIRRFIREGLDRAGKFSEPQ